VGNLDEPRVQFWVEESDLSSVSPGNAVSVVFEALPDLVFTGKIVSVDPALVDVDGTAAVQSYASLDPQAQPVDLLSGMNCDVEIVAGEALNAVLVPLEALRELGTDQYAVFVVLANGEQELRVVTVGLKDYVNAEILSGLEPGEVVSLGSAAETDTQTPSGNESLPAPGIMVPFGGG
jgi:multidrug efflux pump subunit AcrA (membrane-fusion protein)